MSPAPAFEIAGLATHPFGPGRSTSFSKQWPCSLNSKACRGSEHKVLIAVTAASECANCCSIAAFTIKSLLPPRTLGSTLRLSTPARRAAAGQAAEGVRSALSCQRTSERPNNQLHKLERVRSLPAAASRTGILFCLNDLPAAGAAGGRGSTSPRGRLGRPPRPSRPGWPAACRHDSHSQCILTLFAL